MTEPISYIRRTREYYLALGYDNPYQWARFDDVPFARPGKALNAMTLGIVTTAAPVRPEIGDQGPGAPYNAGAKFYDAYKAPTDNPPDLGISHIAYDRDNSPADDPGAFFPLQALRRAVLTGRVGAMAGHFYGFPTNRSQRRNLEIDAPALVEMAVADGVDGIVLVPNCPVCHQSLSIAARALEAAGIPTVIMGCALDIVEQAGVPRFVFSDFPLGNGAGRPGDPESQDQTLAMALDLLENAQGPRSTHRSPLIWPGSPDWRQDYSNPDRLSKEEIAKLRAAFDRSKETARAIREG